MSKLLKTKEWLTLDLCADKLSSGSEKVVYSDLLQFCSDGKLKVSIYLRLRTFVRPVYEYCPLANDTNSIYPHIAKRHIEKKKNNSIEINSIKSETKVPTHDFRTVEFLKEFDEKCSSHEMEIQAESQAVFERFKKRGRARVSYEYDRDCLTKGIHQIQFNPELSDWMTRLALGEDAPYVDLRSLYVISEQDDLLQIVDAESKPKKIRLERDELIIQTKHLIEFEQLLLDGHDQQAKQLPKNTQNQREQVLIELIKQLGKDELIASGRLGVWQELTKIDKALFTVKDKVDETVKKFFTDQKLIILKRGRRKKGKPALPSFSMKSRRLRL